MAVHRFVPKVNRFDFYSYESIGGSIVQLIGECEETFVPTHISTLQVSEIIKRAKLCELLSSIEFTIDSYGLINYYLDSKPNELVNFVYLKDLLHEFNDSESIEFINKSMDFYKQHEVEIENLKTNHDNFEAACEKLNLKIDFRNTLK